MKLHKVFGRVSALFGGLLLVQLAVLAVLVVNQDNTPTQLHASWIDKAEDMFEAIEISDEVVMGKVMRVRPGKDIVVKIEGDEPGPQGGTFHDRIPTLRVEIEVMKTFMGRSGGDRGKTRVIKLFQTGVSVDQNPDVSLPAEVMPPIELADDPDEGEARMFLIEGDPPYLVGEQYALFLTKGPGTGTMAVVAPEGRYRMDMGADGEMMMHPVSDRAMALDMFGMSQAQFEVEVCDTMMAMGLEEMMGDGCQ